MNFESWISSREFRVVNFESWISSREFRVVNPVKVRGVTTAPADPAMQGGPVRLGGPTRPQKKYRHQATWSLGHESHDVTWHSHHNAMSKLKNLLIALHLQRLAGKLSAEYKWTELKLMNRYEHFILTQQAHSDMLILFFMQSSSSAVTAVIDTTFHNCTFQRVTLRRISKSKIYSYLS